MVVMILEKTPASVRGELSRWMLEVRTGVFVGKISALVRDLLWKHVCSRMKAGGCLMIYTNDSEQGFSLVSDGDTSRSIVDYEGLQLIKMMPKL